MSSKDGQDAVKVAHTIIDLAFDEDDEAFDAGIAFDDLTADGVDVAATIDMLMVGIEKMRCTMKRLVKFELIFTSCNAAFEDDPGELERVMSQALAKLIEMPSGGDGVLFDINGNRVGTFKISRVQQS